MNERTIKQMVRDISGVSTSMDETLPKCKITSVSTSRADTAKKPIRKNQSTQKKRNQQQSDSPKRKVRSINIQIKPVEETYNSHKNRNKFCFPCGVSSARIFEQTFLAEDK